ncbi:MAG: alpha/beta hydrolase [Acidimicrobiia bacterium]|nr:alpha/beta hydrolase [Acidimicrobiia bacterium]MDH5288576.1 alpha/beta hydrolase [Acidimicrobiia bacterium]
MQSWQTTYVDSTDGVRVASYDFGGDGPLVVLCHATGFCGLAWLPMVEALRRELPVPARLVALDFRGHGATGLPDGVSLAWGGMADDLAAVIDHYSAQAGQPVGPVWAVGHSMGGAAIILGETARPGLVSRAWTFEPILLRHGPVLTGEGAPAIAVGARARRARFVSRQEAYDRYASRPPLSLLDPRALAAYVEHGFADDPDGDGVMLRCQPEHEASVFEHHNAGTFEAAEALSMPIVVAASGDGGDPAEWVRSAADLNPRLTLVNYPDLTHFGPLQEPDRLAVDVALFFQGDLGSRSDG